MFKYYFENENFHFKYAMGEPEVKNREFHNYNEFVFFMEGNAFFISKKFRQTLKKGSLLLIPKENFHQFCVRQPETYTRCILGFRSTPEIEILLKGLSNEAELIENPDKRIISVFSAIIEIIKSDISEAEKKMFIMSSLVQLIVYFKLSHSESRNNSNLSHVINGALDIIDNEFADRLSVENIAKRLHVSPSTLSHKFRNELNIPVYKYITKKRLSVARSLIENGESLINASLKSGFKDYSCFYRLYKKYFPK